MEPLEAEINREEYAEVLRRGRFTYPKYRSPALTIGGVLLALVLVCVFAVGVRLACLGIVAVYEQTKEGGK